MKKKPFLFLSTDTCPGIMLPLSEGIEGCKRINMLKGRAPEKPLGILLPSLSILRKIGLRYSKGDLKFLKRPYSFVCFNTRTSPLLENFPKEVLVRVPRSREVSKAFSRYGPLLQSSMNISGEDYKKFKDEEAIISNFKIDRGSFKILGRLKRICGSSAIVRKGIQLRSSFKYSLPFIQSGFQQKNSPRIN